MSTLSHDEIRKRLAINYSRVTLTLSSHDAGGLTERDFRLAGQIDA